MSLMNIGSIAYDYIKTPYGVREVSLGGSATYASIASSKFTDTYVVGVVGTDYEKQFKDVFKRNRINDSAIEIVDGETFHWKGVYEDLNEAITLDTKLNVFESFKPKIPESLRNIKNLFLGNIQPELQLHVLKQMDKETFVAIDTMNFWIEKSPETLKKVIGKIDILFINDAEIKLLLKERNVYEAIEKCVKLGVNNIVVKRGEFGSLLYSNSSYFFVPVYPINKVIDPTGAGDSFAGGFMGYVSYKKNCDTKTLKEAMLYATVTASYNIQDFSFDELETKTINDIENRVEKLKDMIRI